MIQPMNGVGPPSKFQIVAGVGGRGLKGGRAQTLRSEVGGAYRGPKSHVLILGVQLMVVQTFFVQLGGRIWGEVEPKREVLAHKQREV